MSTERIRELNDALRTTFAGGRVVVTAGVNALPTDVQAMILRKVATFGAFDEGNDPHGEHDFGSFEHTGRTFFWKIDYYDTDMCNGSPDPSDPNVTTRVLTVMLSEEY